VVSIAERARSATPDEHRQLGALRGKGLEGEVTQLLKRTLERLGRPGPQVAPQPDRLVEVGTPPVEAVRRP
jgi:hypothetical protein